MLRATKIERLGNTAPEGNTPRRAHQGESFLHFDVTVIACFTLWALTWSRCCLYSRGVVALLDSCELQFMDNDFSKGTNVRHESRVGLGVGAPWKYKGLVVVDVCSSNKLQLTTIDLWGGGRVCVLGHMELALSLTQVGFEDCIMSYF